MHVSNGSAKRSVDWREWVAFLGYVLATSVVVSVALASVVLLLATQADDTAPGLAEPPRLQSPRPAPTILRQGPAASAAGAAIKAGVIHASAEAADTAVTGAAVGTKPVVPPVQAAAPEKEPTGRADPLPRQAPGSQGPITGIGLQHLG